METLFITQPLEPGQQQPFKAVVGEQEDAQKHSLRLNNGIQSETDLASLSRVSSNSSIAGDMPKSVFVESCNVQLQRSHSVAGLSNTNSHLHQYRCSPVMDKKSIVSSASATNLSATNNNTCNGGMNASLMSTSTMQSPENDSSNMFQPITLKVGGQLFSTTLKVLTSIPDSFFSSLFSTGWQLLRQQDGSGERRLLYPLALFSPLLFPSTFAPLSRHTNPHTFCSPCCPLVVLHCCRCCARSAVFQSPSMAALTCSGMCFAISSLDNFR